MSQIELVNTESRLAEVVDHLSRAPQVAVDIESNGFFRYHERVCLVQLAIDGTAFLVDPLAINELGMLGHLLEDRSVEKIFHATDYDLRSLDRDWGFRVNRLFDTCFAAALVGSEQLGLQSVVKEQVGVELAKPRKLQRSDWTMRPLSPEALEYAANDVLHLKSVRKALSERLKDLSRLSWAQEEFARLEDIRYIRPDRELAFLSIKGSRDLDRRGLAVLRSLVQFREEEASRLDLPPFKVIPNFALIRLSLEPAAGLTNVRGLGQYGRPPADRGLKAAICKGVESQPETWPKRQPSKEKGSSSGQEEVRNRLSSLKKWRRELGLELGLNPGLLWPTVSLERLSECPTDLEIELESPDVRNWQRDEFSLALRSVHATLS